MLMFTLAVSCLTTSSLPWFMDLTFQVPMQYCSLQHWTLPLSPVTSTTGYCFALAPIPSFFLELFLHWSPVAYWATTDLGSSSFSILSFCLFILFMGFSRQGYWSGLPFPSPVDHILTECELPDVQAGFRKGRGTRNQVAKSSLMICWIIKKARGLQKNIYFSFINYAKASDCVDHNKLWKILKEMGIPDHLTCLLRNLYAGQEATVRTGNGTTNWFQIGKEYVKAVYCHPAYLTSMQSTSWEILGWKKHKLESRLLGEISITSNMQMTPPLWKKVKRN